MNKAKAIWKSAKRTGGGSVSSGPRSQTGRAVRQHRRTDGLVMYGVLYCGRFHCCNSKIYFSIFSNSRSILSYSNRLLLLIYSLLKLYLFSYSYSNPYCWCSYNFRQHNYNFCLNPCNNDALSYVMVYMLLDFQFRSRCDMSLNHYAALTIMIKINTLC